MNSRKMLKYIRNRMAEGTLPVMCRITHFEGRDVECYLNGYVDCEECPVVAEYEGSRFRMPAARKTLKSIYTYIRDHRQAPEKFYNAIH